MRSRDDWIPLAWYLGVAVALPLARGAPLGEHVTTTLVAALVCFAIYSGARRLLR
jgi:hypothetical protein